MDMNDIKNRGLLGMFSGMQLVIQKPIKVVIKRTWKERLFTRPWEPSRKLKYEYQDLIEDGQALKSNGTLIMNQNASHLRTL